MSKELTELFTVTIEKLVHGGQGLAELPDGRKVFVWNALPGETVKVRLIKQKRSYAEAVAEEIVTASKDRIEPKDANYLATSPWQIMNWQVENQAKSDIVRELFEHERVVVPAFGPAETDGDEWHYRNKMEYSFWGDDDGLHLALHRRGSHGKEIVEGSALALPAVDAAAQAVLHELRRLNVRASFLKTVMVRANQNGEAVAALFVKPKKFPHMPLPAGLKGMVVYHSNPKSPASVATELITTRGTIALTDTLMERPFHYDVTAFFQVNLPVFELALQKIKTTLGEATELTDMYGGVGSIGLSVAERSVDIIELDAAATAMASMNAESRPDLNIQIIQTLAEKALDYIKSDRPIIFDPPRAGLHQVVTDKIIEVKPPLIIYVSCNPATQARDLARLQDSYEVIDFAVYNFFPRTPHIETLAVLKLKK